MEGPGIDSITVPAFWDDLAMAHKQRHKSSPHPGMAGPTKCMAFPRKIPWTKIRSNAILASWVWVLERQQYTFTFSKNKMMWWIWLHNSSWNLGSVSLSALDPPSVWSLLHYIIQCQVLGSERSFDKSEGISSTVLPLWGQHILFVYDSKKVQHLINDPKFRVHLESQHG